MSATRPALGRVVPFLLLSGTAARITLGMRIPFLNNHPNVAVIRLQGQIAAARSGGLSDAGLRPVLERAFKRRKPVAVALILNSPGGSPVQSSLIAARIRRLAEEHRVPVHAFVEDVAASGGYWLATAADHIWLDDSSIVGSIGVISAGFGFQDFIARHGIQRRLFTSGQSKSMLDPFLPEKPEDVARLERLMTPMHENFIAQVQARRGSRLSMETDLFTGDVWIGQQAVQMGLADGIAHLEPKLRSLYGDDVRLLRYGQKVPLLRRFGVSATDVIDAAQDRAAWARFGLD